jgi:phage tail sheath protein FI
MIGIERIEIDRSQVLRPPEGESYGMVLNVPYGPIVPTYIDSEGLLMSYFTPAGTPDPTYKDYYEAIVLLKQAPILACRPQGDALYGGVTVENTGSGYEVAPLVAGVADPNAYTFPSNLVQFAILGAEPSAANNNYSVEISASTTQVAYTFDIDLYYDSEFVANFNVSLRRVKDAFGNSVYIEDVISGRSDIQVVVNTEADLTVMPVYTVSEVSFGSGSTNTTFDSTALIAAWQPFKQYNKYFTHFLVDTSCLSLVGKEVIDIAEANWYQHAFLGAPSIKATNARATEELNTWKTSTLDYRDVNGTDLNVNSDHASLYAVWGKVSDNYNGTTLWISPVSTAAARRAYTNKAISFSQAACGLNAGRGTTNDFIEMEQDSSGVVDELGNKQINTITYTPGGKCVWNEWTLQTSHSNTSYQSHRTLFNTLEENIEALLLTFVFTDNNATTRNDITSILNSYLKPMVGVHLEAVEVRCDETNNPASLINLRKMKVQVAVIPYAKANKIIFEFIHSRSGVTLSEVF